MASAEPPPKPVSTPVSTPLSGPVSTPVWQAGDPAWRDDLVPVVKALLAEREVVWVRRREARRRLAWARLPDGRRCFLKHFLRGSRHRFREGWKRRLRLSTAEREWRALRRLHAAGLPVPRPLALFALEDGGSVLVTDFVDGRPLAAALETPRRERAARLEALGRAVRRLHAAGWVHRDLHSENVLATAEGVVLTDLQAALPTRSRTLRLRDLGELDYSLARQLGSADRLRLRVAALGVTRPFDAAARNALRALARSSRARGRAHAHSRARRSLRAGRRARLLCAAGGAGLVLRDADESAVRAALGGADAPGLEVRHFEGSFRDLWRGSPARRAWYAAHALEARGVPRRGPVAFLEWRRCGRASRSALVLEANPAVEVEPGAWAEALTTLWIQLHEAGFSAPDPGAGGVVALRRGARLEARVAALEDVALPRRLRDATRGTDLARLDAALDAAGVPDAARRRALARYRARLPFRTSR